jgi:hypothetical protein
MSKQSYITITDQFCGADTVQFLYHILCLLNQNTYAFKQNETSTTDYKKSGSQMPSLWERLQSNRTITKNMQLGMQEAPLGEQLKIFSRSQSRCNETIQPNSQSKESQCLERKVQKREVGNTGEARRQMYCLRCNQPQLASYRLCSNDVWDWLQTSEIQKMGDRQPQRLSHSLRQSSLRINHYWKDRRDVYNAGNKENSLDKKNPITHYKTLADTNNRQGFLLCGNAITPPAMELLVERCIQSLS